MKALKKLNIPNLQLTESRLASLNFFTLAFQTTQSYFFIPQFKYMKFIHSSFEQQLYKSPVYTHMTYTVLYRYSRQTI